MHDPRTVEGFGREWAAFDQTGLDPHVLESMFAAYFGIFPWEALPDRAVGVDVGCGSGRWARLMAERVGKVVCVDPSAQALEVARRVLPDNCSAVEGAAGVPPFYCRRLGSASTGGSGRVNLDVAGDDASSGGGLSRSVRPDRPDRVLNSGGGGTTLTMG